MLHHNTLYHNNNNLVDIEKNINNADTTAPLPKRRRARSVRKSGASAIVKNPPIYTTYARPRVSEKETVKVTQPAKIDKQTKSTPNRVSIRKSSGSDIAKMCILVTPRFGFSPPTRPKSQDAIDDEEVDEYMAKYGPNGTERIKEANPIDRQVYMNAVNNPNVSPKEATMGVGASTRSKVFANQIEKQKQFTIDGNIDDVQKCEYIRFRAQYIDWMNSYCHKLKYCDEVFYLAIKISDRFFHEVQVDMYRREIYYGNIVLLAAKITASGELMTIESEPGFCQTLFKHINRDMMRPEDRRDIYRICDVINESHDDILSNLKFDEILYVNPVEFLCRVFDIFNFYKQDVRGDEYPEPSAKRLKFEIMNGELEGCEFNVMRFICEALSVDYKFVRANWSGVEVALCAAWVGFKLCDPKWQFPDILKNADQWKKFGITTFDFAKLERQAKMVSVHVANVFTCLLNDFFVNPKGEVQTRGVKRPTKINKNEPDSFGTRFTYIKYNSADRGCVAMKMFLRRHRIQRMFEDVV